jgi:hypothetical protein
MITKEILWWNTFSLREQISMVTKNDYYFPEMQGILMSDLRIRDIKNIYKFHNKQVNEEKVEII